MNSQNTPVHIRLWHRDFWLMAIANTLLTTAIYMLVPTMPRWLIDVQGFTTTEAALAMASFGVGLFSFGLFVSFLVQYFRRNHVCIWSIALMTALIFSLYYYNTRFCQFVEVPLIILLRFALGAFFGLAQMVLTSTLIIDTCESYQRTEANHSAAWFGRFALSIGPLAGLLLNRLFNFDAVLLAAAGCLAVSLILIMLVSFPFRAPSDNISATSLDRFFLTHGFPLFVNLQLVMLAVGILFSTALSELFFSMMMAGFLLAILSQRFVFRDAELKSEVVTGLILIAAALLMMVTRTQQIVDFAAPLFIGLGTGIIGSRFLLFFIKLSRHCQRGTSQSTFMLGWESGIAWGLGIGIAFFYGDGKMALIASLVLIAVALLMYHFTHNWFAKHKNR